ncbi:apoptosis-inducing factor 3 [Episyrphus balteatus]|uniref:apoptosis-inducing factor 3 n=1 Tax=Episyrphus balteatus TaxID=286459 RepID=UPI0024860C11|nr:apoptosis-inducing factor 3 [Episyrphus balteatus]
MGSINCKEYKTNKKNAACAQENDGDTGSYKFRSESDMEDIIEKVVCNESDIQENQMKQLNFDEDSKILLIKQNGKLTAIGNKCSHYGAPLHTGSLGDGRVRCPWHGACFNTETGDIEDFPGLDSIPCYKVKVEKDGQVKVQAKKSALDKNKRIKDMVKRDENNDKTFIVVGGGPSAGVCVETLRQEGFTGRIVMICKENTQPYDRVKVSKTLDTDVSKMQFRNMDFYNEYSIELMLGVEATKLDANAKIVTCSNGYAIKFDKIYIATGSQAVKVPIPGYELENIFTVRDHADAVAINPLISKDLDVVCLGSSFIALEAAAALVKKVKSVTLIGRDNVPLKPSFGDEIGERVLQLFKDNNVNMIMNSGVKQILGTNGKVSEVELIDGTKIPCGMCIMGVGSRCYTDFLKDSGIAINPNGSIDTDIHLKTNIDDIYVGGDIANAPVYTIGNERATIGHYQLAQYHGRIAAMNMAGKAEELQAVPYFWTMLFGKSFRYSGYGKAASIKIVGSVQDLKFVAFYLDEQNNVISTASCNRDPVVSQYADLVAMGKKLHKDDLEVEDPFAWTQSLMKTDARVC